MPAVINQLANLTLHNFSLDGFPNQKRSEQSKSGVSGKEVPDCGISCFFALGLHSYLVQRNYLFSR